MTDGVGVSVMKSRRRPRPRQPPLEAPAADQPEFEYIHRLNGDQQALIQDNCVVVDPGRRDMLFFVHEDSDATTPMRFRFTKSYQNKNEKRIKFRRIRNHVKTRDVRNAEQRLVNSKCTNLNQTAHGLSAGVYRLWNRDLSACINMIQILVSVRAGQGIPDRFKRAPQQNNQNMNLPR
ncbi:hypothetical protein MBANPS3_010568 [Mucor bainieri]